MNIFLIGPRGSGKSTIGPMIARGLGWPFVELDDLALRRTRSKTVHDVWSTLGEQAWRTAESESLLGVLAKQSQVVALGGGAPTVPAIRTAIEQARGAGAAMVVYLRCPVAQLQKRLSDDPGDRPSLIGNNVVDEVAAVLASREATYLQLADFSCDTGSNQPAAVAAKVIDAVNARQSALNDALNAKPRGDRPDASS